MIRKTCLTVVMLGALASGASATTLDHLLPRGSMVCYGATPDTHAVFKMVRVTRPERFQSYDSPTARMVRVVLNFRAPAGRLEDTASCRLSDGVLVCVSTSCDGTEFRIEPTGDQFVIRFEPTAPRAIWSCAERPLRDVSLNEKDRLLKVERGTGACLDD